MNDKLILKDGMAGYIDKKGVFRADEFKTLLVIANRVDTTEKKVDTILELIREIIQNIIVMKPTKEKKKK